MRCGLADSLRKMISESRFVWEGKSFSTGISIGLVTGIEPFACLNDLMKIVDAACFMAINQIGHVMNKNTIAEFGENDAIFTILKRIGVEYARGYGIGKPEPFKPISCSAHPRSRRHRRRCAMQRYRPSSFEFRVRSPQKFD